MITMTNKNTGEKREYSCRFDVLSALALANVECLMHIALADPDEHIEAMGGEDKLLELMNKYLNLYERIIELDVAYGRERLHRRTSDGREREEDRTV